MRIIVIIGGPLGVYSGVSLFRETAIYGLECMVWSSGFAACQSSVVRFRVHGFRFRAWGCHEFVRSFCTVWLLFRSLGGTKMKCRDPRAVEFGDKKQDPLCTYPYGNFQVAKIEG